MSDLETLIRQALDGSRTLTVRRLDQPRWYEAEIINHLVMNGRRGAVDPDPVEAIRKAIMTPAPLPQVAPRQKAGDLFGPLQPWERRK